MNRLQRYDKILQKPLLIAILMMIKAPQLDSAIYSTVFVLKGGPGDSTEALLSLAVVWGFRVVSFRALGLIGLRVIAYRFNL